MATIEDLLNALKAPSKEEKMSAKEFWDRLSSGETWKDMDFDNEKEYEKFMEANPYDSI